MRISLGKVKRYDAWYMTGICPLSSLYVKYAKMLA